ncbi:iron transporter [Halopiger thermotolerans]
MSNMPELKPSDEVDERHLELARQAGDAYREAAEHMIEEVAETGAKTESGDYIVGFAQEEAEGLYRMQDGGLEWEEPAENENCHLEVVVASRADGRFLPGVDVRVTIEDDGDAVVGPTEIPFLWHPGLYHYGGNFELPGDGTYAITVEVDPPEWPRHDERNGDRFAEPVEERFEDVQIETGRD